jgi:hypothetical protein
MRTSTAQAGEAAQSSSDSDGFGVRRGGPPWLPLRTRYRPMLVGNDLLFVPPGTFECSERIHSLAGVPLARVVTATAGTSPAATPEGAGVPYDFCSFAKAAAMAPRPEPLAVGLAPFWLFLRNSR